MKPLRSSTGGTPLRRAKGRILACSLPGSSERDYILFVPHRLDASLPPLVSVHGISRNADEHVELFAERADDHGAVVVAPCFELPRFQGYQRLSGRPRPERFLMDVLADAQRRARHSMREFHLFGYSGGAQFAHRLALVRPGRVRSLLLASAGWYTFPDPEVPYPRGVGYNPAYRRARCRLQRFLALPVRVLVGELDTEQDPALNLDAGIEAQQGVNRLERATRWVAALRKAALASGSIPLATLRTLPGVGHSFEQSVTLGGLDRIVFEALY